MWLIYYLVAAVSLIGGILAWHSPNVRYQKFGPVLLSIGGIAAMIGVIRLTG